LMLDRLTARHTYCVWFWSKLFNEHDLKGTCTDRGRFYAHVKVQTGLPGHMVQCCFDMAAWMWRSYRQLHRDWRWQVAQAKRSGDRKWLRKLLKREPRKPFTNGMQGKVPIWFDSQIGTVEKSKTMRLCRYVARISTLRRGMKLTIPLNPAEYHLNLLDSGTMKSFQLVKRDGKYHVHVKVEYTFSNQPVCAVRGIDLGVKRSMASVTLRPCQPLRSSDFHSAGWVEAGPVEPSEEADSGTTGGAEVGAAQAVTAQATARKSILRPTSREAGCRNIT